MAAFLLKKVAVVIAAVATTTEAHNKMTVPQPTWPEGVYNQNSPPGTIDPSKALPAPKGKSYNTDPGSNTDAYWTAFNASKYKSLKELAWDTQDLASGATNECGFSTVKGKAQALPAQVEWGFFTASHQGPCKVWCDDTLVFENYNCAVDYPDTPAKLPYDKSKCSGAAMLTSYWIALHSTPWQVYTNCAPLSGCSSTSKSTTSGSTSTSTKQTTDSSSASTSAAQTPSSGGGSSTTDSPSANTPKVISAPASGGSPSATTAPSSNTSPSTSTTSAPSTPTTDESDCGSYDVAGGSAADEGLDNGTPTTDGNTYQQGGNTSTETQTNTGESTNQGSNTGGNTNQGTNKHEPVD
ncbi:hypothetical protein V7S43_003929 [Phytophthora oleae]|uniref:Secreted protein n=1 Tax=Phytophthora oleae TaxID=2107226 RepID=A0ABD3FWP8_9STRA